MPGHVFVTLNNATKISCDSWCLSGTAWWHVDPSLTEEQQCRERCLLEICEKIEISGPRGLEIKAKEKFFGGVIKGLKVPEKQDPGFERVAVIGRGALLEHSPPVGVFTSVRVPSFARDDPDKKVQWLTKSLEEYLVAAARWLAGPRDELASALWESAQEDPVSAPIWDALYPADAELLNIDNFVERIGAALRVAMPSASLTKERAKEMLNSLFAPKNLDQVFREGGLVLDEFKEALFKGEPKRARRKCYLLSAPVLGTGMAGGKLQTGKVVQSIMSKLLNVLHGDHRLWPKGLDGKPIDADAVLVCADRETYTAAQRVRETHSSEYFPPCCLAQDPGSDRHMHEKANKIALEINAGKLAVFIGAGVSAGAGLPSWGAGLEKTEKQVLSLIKHKTGDDHHGIDLPDKWKVPIDWAGVLEDELHRHRVDQELFRKYHPQSSTQQSQDTLTPGSMIKELFLSHLISKFYSLTAALLAGLDVDKMVTQNYDELMEQASDNVEFLNPHRKYAHLSVLPERPRSTSVRWLLKMHGCQTNPSSVVLTKNDYEGYDGRYQALAGLVQGTMLTDRMLFIGFSGMDENYKKILRAVKQAKPATEQKDMATLLQIVDENVEHDNCVDVLTFNLEGSIPTGARIQEIFVDMVACFEVANTPIPFLDDRFESAISDDLKWLKKRLLSLHHDVKERSNNSPASLSAQHLGSKNCLTGTKSYKKIKSCLKDLGLEEKELPVAEAAGKQQQTKVSVGDLEGIRLCMDRMVRKARDNQQLGELNELLSKARAHESISELRSCAEKLAPKIESEEPMTTAARKHNFRNIVSQVTKNQRLAKEENCMTLKTIHVPILFLALGFALGLLAAHSRSSNLTRWI